MDEDDENDDDDNDQDEDNEDDDDDADGKKEGWWCGSSKDGENDDFDLLCFIFSWVTWAKAHTSARGMNALLLVFFLLLCNNGLM